MIQQVEFSLRPLPRGFHLVTNEVTASSRLSPRNQRGDEEPASAA